MLTASPITRQTVGRTFTIALGVLGVGVVLQLGAVGWAFIARFHAQPFPGEGSPGDQPTFARLTKPPALRPDFSSDPFAEPSEQPPQQITTNPSTTGVPPRPMPVPLNMQKPADAVPQTRFDELVLQGKQLRERGDTGNALTKFREANAMDPRNPIAIAELAATYEKMRLMDRSAEQWKRIYEMGDSAGLYFSLAESKLKESQARAILEAVPQPGAAASPGGEVEGITSGAMLGLGRVTADDMPDEASEKRFTLHVPIKARPRSRIDVHDLVIHVLFYDIVDGQNVVQTSANVNSRWTTAPVDWADSDTEELAVEYQLPRPEPGRAKRESRKFFGYIVRVYYKQQLQASAAEPARLAQQYPPPQTLPKENDK
jgi:hypothetical protein